jgi:transposase
MANRPPVARIDVTPAHLHTLLARVRPKLAEEEYRELEALVETLVQLAEILANQKTSIARLRALLFGACTEKTRDVLARAGLTAEAPSPGRDEPLDPQTGRADGQPARAGHRRGHGRNGATAYTGGQRITIPHPHLKPGDPCPRCATGKVYVQREPKVLVRFVGQAPIGATVYALERLRCHLCGDVFTAPPPKGVGEEKYDATTGAMVGLLKYGGGVPFYRLEQLQANVHIPLPASTQWEIVATMAQRIQPVLDELIRQAAQGDVLYNDDTGMTVLSLLPKETTDRQDQTARDPATVDGEVSPERTGVFTSGIVATRDGHRLALYFTGRRHAGENLATVLAHRAPGLPPPIQMCDALSRNVPKAFEVILANCLSHARRNVVDVTPNFPAACRYVLETLRDVYSYDAQAREQRLSPQARLAFHHTHSRPLMEGLHAWFTTQLDDHLVEPNSGLGQAITYFVKHWTTLTRFLQVAGAPLDNNLVERALKKAILHRKAALFYKTPNGAHVGDLFMSAIHTCELNGVNAFEYLVELQRHADALKQTPGAWMPWTYRETLRQLGASVDSG